MKKYSKFLILGTLFLALPLASCGEAPADPYADKKLVQAVTLNIEYVSLGVGETANLEYDIVFKDDQNHDIDVKWITSDINVCSVENGLVTALGSGDATVSIIAGYKMATCAINVPSSGESSFNITLEPSTLTLAVGQQYQLIARTDVETTVTYSSSNTSVVNVDKTGLVTAVGIGEADVGASALGVSASSHITVLDAGDLFIRLNASNVDLLAGDTYQLVATLKDPSASVTWSTSNDKLATVDQNGKVTAKADVEGTVTISATANGNVANCIFNIINEDDPYDATIYFFIDYNNIDLEDTSGTKLLAKFRWYNDQPLSGSGKIPANPTTPMDPAFPYFIGWSAHTIIDSKADLWDINTDVVGNATFLRLYGIWSDVPVGEFNK